MPNEIKSPEWVKKNYQKLLERMNGDGSVGLENIRQKAFDSFEKEGFPGRREEAWRFTDLSLFKQQTFSPAPDHKIDRSVIEPFTMAGVNNCIVFINGRLDRSLSDLSRLPAGIRIKSMSEALVSDAELLDRWLGRSLQESGYRFANLNSAFIQDGLVVHVDEGVTFTDPIHLIFYSQSSGAAFVSHPRLLMVFEKNSQASVIEHYVSREDDLFFTNPVTELIAKENAHVDHVKLMQESDAAYHIAVQGMLQHRHSQLTSFSASFGGGLVRNDIRSVIDGEGVTSTLNGLYMVSGKQHVDFHTYIDHAQPHTNSRQLYKGILTDRGRGVFNGKIYVRRPAQKTDAIQNNKNLILSDTASVDTQPMLEIFADDVKCTHGGTVGQLDTEAILYLRSRGIGLEHAK